MIPINGDSTMPHVTEKPTTVLTLSDFVTLHSQQLLGSGIPERYWANLFSKLKDEASKEHSFVKSKQNSGRQEKGQTPSAKKQHKGKQVTVTMAPGKARNNAFFKRKNTQFTKVYDAGSCFQIVQMQYEAEDGDEEDVHEYKVRVIDEEGIDETDPKHIYLIDHAWTYRLTESRTQLTTVPSLLERMANMMEIPINTGDKTATVEAVLQEMWRFNQTYNLGNAIMGSEEALPVWYIMDEFGSRITHSDDPSFRTVPFYYIPSQLTFTLMWPRHDLEQGDDVTRDFVENVRDPIKRAARLLPWKHTDFTAKPHENEKMEDAYFLEFKGVETLPNPDTDLPVLPKDQSIKVYFDYEVFSKHMTDPRFEVVQSTADADIWWLRGSFKDFKDLSVDAPNTFVNQFPNESLITVKDLLAITARQLQTRGSNSITSTKGDNSGPKWLPITYNLQSELTKFVSCFQKREAEGLDNYWICKPWNLARGLDIHITNNINHIMRLPDTGPKVACKYVEDPVLFHREGIGEVKFDVRYIVMLSSTSPLKIYVYRVFWLRFANKAFTMDQFDDYEIHFTVMNYKPGVNLKQIHYDDFIPMFESQYPDFSWADVEGDIFTMIRELFEAAVSCPYPQGIPPSPQSRAMYAVDLLLKWDTNNTGEKIIQPVICEVNFGPDCERACKYHPNFINDVLSTLFMDDITDRPVTALI